MTKGRTVDRGLIFRFYFWKGVVVVDSIASTTNRKEAVVYQ